MNRQRSHLVLIIALFPGIGAVQSLGYSDADTPSEAIGMMKTNMHTAEVLKRECSARLPDKATEMEKNLNRWKEVEAHALERTDHYWGQMIQKEPRLEEVLTRAETAIKGQIELLEKTDSDKRLGAVSQFCVQHFSDLASGVWRQRTPRLYAFLDRAP